MSLCTRHCSWKLSDRLRSGWRKTLGEAVEGTVVAMAVCLLLFVDLICTFIDEIIQNTDLLNPKYEDQGEGVAKWCEHISLVVLVLFMLELSLGVVAFGKRFFSHIWYLLDFGVVLMSLICEIVSRFYDADGAQLLAGILILLRAWKFFAFGFDILMLRHKVHEFEEEHNIDGGEPTPAPALAEPDQENRT
mmetsp:Transcript_127395/g.407754  ORF Transcript_127395/g.407754 Transcript_127395/m.407754 type:complete len:191 (-) Transcript_127395:142-714(-)